jgi:hypothetical protein
MVSPVASAMLDDVPSDKNGIAGSKISARKEMTRSVYPISFRKFIVPFSRAAKPHNIGPEFFCISPCGDMFFNTELRPNGADYF